MRLRLAVWLLPLYLFAADYPAQDWQFHSRTGWSESMLKAAREFTATRKTAAVVVVQSGKVVDQWGDVAKRIGVRSIRKSFLSALYGIHVDEGHIDLSKTLDAMGVDDKEPSLTSIEKQATLLDLLRSRSGVYHPAAFESPAMKAERPPRGSHSPGEFYYYNNWDFNTLGGIFEKLTGSKIFEEFERRIAQPLGMQDYRAADGRYLAEPESIYPAYPFSMSARDMARFGYLYLRNGRWGDRQIVPAEWVSRSTTAYTQGLASDYDPYGGYGLLWWVGDYGYFALGHGGHVIAVIPSKDLVVVHRVDNDNRAEANAVPYRDIDTMIRLIMNAAPSPLK